MTNRYAAFTTDEEAEKKGIEVLLGDDTRCYVARAGGANKAFGKALATATKPYRRAIEAGTMPETLAEELIHKVYAKHCVLRWEVKLEDEWVSGIDIDEEGQVVPFTTDAVISLFKETPELFRFITDAAGDVSNFQAVMREADLGN